MKFQYVCFVHILDGTKIKIETFTFKSKKKLLEFVADVLAFKNGAITQIQIPTAKVKVN